MHTMPGSNEIRIEMGAVIAYRLFDIAYAIDLPKVEAIWARQAKASTRARLTATPPKAMAFGVPPVALALEPIDIPLPDGPVQASVTARLYDFGAVTLALRVPVRGMGWSGFARLTNDIDAAVGTEARGAGMAPPAGGRASNGRRGADPTDLASHRGGFPRRGGVRLRYAADRNGACCQRADLVTAAVRRAAAAVGGGTHGPAAAALLLLHRRPGGADLGPRLHLRAARRDRRRWTCWRSPTRSCWRCATTTSCWMPSCRACTTWWRARGRLRPLFAARRFANLARRFYTLVAEVTELTEKVDNALQVTEDVYLGAHLRRGAGPVPRATGERRGGTQAGDHPRHLHGAVRRVVGRPGGTDGIHHRGADFVGAAGGAHPPR